MSDSPRATRWGRGLSSIRALFIVSYLSLVISLAVCGFVAYRAVSETVRLQNTFCGMISPYADTVRATPPQNPPNPRGESFAKGALRADKELDCSDAKIVKGK